MAGCAGTSKAFMVIISLVFWAAAAGLFFLGSYVFVQYGHYEHLAESLYTLVPATIILAAGFFFFILGILGCVGACKEQRCLLALFFTLILVIFVGMVCAGILGWVYRSRVDDAVQKGLQQGLDDYNLSNETYWQDEVDFMQSNLHCCGINNYTDWANTAWAKQTHKLYPDSCCENNNCTSTANHTGKVPYQHGCYTELKDKFLTHLGIIAGVCAGFALVLILGMIFSCVLICKRRSEVPYIGLSEPSGVRV